MRCVVPLLLLLLGLGRANAAAQDFQDAARVAAEREHRAAVTAFARRDYRRAITLSMRADALRPSPGLAYNIARAHEALADSAGALRWYREYLRRAPFAADRQRVADRIARHEARLAASPVPEEPVLVVSEAEPTTPPPAMRARAEVSTPRLTEPRTSSPASRTSNAQKRQVGRRGLVESDRSSALSTVGLISVAVGAAGLGAAIGYEVARSNAESDASRQTQQIEYAEALELVEDRRDLARLFAVLGGITTLGGVVMIAVAEVDSDAREEPLAWVDVKLGLSVRGGNAALYGRF